MSKYLNFSSLYLFAWIVFSLLGFVINAPKLYAVLLYSFSAIAVSFSIYSIFEYRLPTYLKFLFLLVFFLSIYGGYLIILGDDVYWQFTGYNVGKDRYFLWLTTSLLTVVPIYVFTCKGLIDDKVMKWFFFLAFVSAIIAFYGSMNMQLKLAKETGSSSEEFSITNVYSFLSIMPLLILLKKQQILQLALLCVLIVYLILSAKRGPIILGSVCSIVVVWSAFYNCSIKKKFVYVLVFICILIGLYEFITYQLNSSPYFAYRVEQTLSGYTSGRDDYAKRVFDYYINSTSTTQFFFGIGAQGTLSVNESYAHNDWLAILLEQGVAGFILFLLSWLSFGYSWLKARTNFDCFVAVGILLFVGLGKTFFSMYYLPISQEMITSSGFFAITLGYFLAKAFPQQENIVLTVDLKENG